MKWREELTRRFPDLRKLPRGCYIVGGAIRDLLMGIEPADADVACHDPLAAAKTIRPRAIRLGDQEHLSAWRVVAGPHIYDFAALLDNAILPDLERRDFTVNAMAVDLESDELIDPFGGRSDVAAKSVRMVRASNFDDDPLRTLKGVRLAVKYDMEIDGATLSAMRQRAPRITEMAVERVNYELSLILSAGKLRRAIALLRETQLLEPLGFESREPKADDVSLAGAYALLVSDPEAYGRRWRWSARLVRDVIALQRLVETHDRMSLYDAGEPLARQLPALLRALGRDEQLDVADFAIVALLTGQEIAALASIASGPEVGRIKRALLEAQVRGEVGTRDQAEALVRSLATA
ncbi:MAG TPA: hypothetical protein VF701_05450 [Thermoanaerobaculia bacterium]